MIYRPTDRKMIMILFERHGMFSVISALLYVWGLLYDIEYQALQDYMYQNKEQEQDQ